MSDVSSNGHLALSKGANPATRRVTINAGMREYAYPYFLGSNCAGEINDAVVAMEPDCVIVVADDIAWQLHGSALSPLRAAVETLVITVPQGERAKQPTVLADVIATAIAGGATRKSVVVTFGGGAAGNLGGLVAALLFRGVRLVHMPTTTIGAFDSVLSMKQAVNSESGKNQIGTYHRPAAVMVDTTWFNTLGPEVARGGWCEAAKNVLAIAPASLQVFEQLIEWTDPARQWAALFDISLSAKTVVMAHDPFERREALTLEYGHTIGHALEYSTTRSDHPIAHGDAIALGMIAAARISHALGYLDDGAVRLHEALTAKVGAPTRLPSAINLDRVLAVVRRDNKRGLIRCGENEIPMVILAQLGQAVVPGGDGLPLMPVAAELVASVLGGLVLASDR